MALHSWLEALELEPDGTTTPFEVTEPFGFKFHSTKTEKSFPHCCDFHQTSFQEVKKWAKDFLKEDEAVELAKKTVLNLAYTGHYLRFAFDLESWYEDISYNLEVNIFSFGSSIKKAERYLLGVIGVIKSIQNETNFEKSEKISYLAFLWLKNSLISRDLLHFRKAFDKWFFSFPFELSFLHELKDKYDLFFGIVNDDFTDLDDSSFMAEINKMTDAILYHYNTSNLYKKGLSFDAPKLKFELIASQRTYQLNNDNFYGQDSDNDPVYKKMILKWFEDEIKYLDKIINLTIYNPGPSTSGVNQSVSSPTAATTDPSIKSKLSRAGKKEVDENYVKSNSGSHTLNQVCIALFCMQIPKESPDAKIIIEKYYGIENPSSLKNHNITSKSQFASITKNFDKDKWKRGDLQKVLQLVSSENHSLGIEKASQYWSEFWAAYTKHYKTDND